MECWDWSHWAVLVVALWVWHNFAGDLWSELWSWAKSWWK